jgi:hypothetical protein
VKIADCATGSRKPARNNNQNKVCKGLEVIKFEVKSVISRIVI